MTLIPEVEAALTQAIDRHQARRGASHGRIHGGRGSFGARLWRAASRIRELGLIGVSVLVTLAVVAVVLSVGHASRQNAAPAGPPNSVASRRRLISVLGVLREPQSKAAAEFNVTGWPTPPKGPGSQIAPDRPLVRLAITTPWGAKVFIVPLTAPQNPTLRKDLGETVAVWVQGIGWADYNVLANLVAGGGWGPGQTVTDRDGTKLARTFALVPDGVTKVAFYPEAKLNQTTDHGPLVTATVHNNIAVFQTPAHGLTTLLGYWYGPGGRILKRFGFAQPKHFTSKPPAKLTRPRRPIWCPTVFHAQTAQMSEPNQKLPGSFDTRRLIGQSATKAATEARRHGCAWRVINHGEIITADGRPNRIDANVIDGIVTAIGVY